MRRQAQQLAGDHACGLAAGRHLSAKRIRLWCDEREPRGQVASVVAPPTRWRSQASGT